MPVETRDVPRPSRLSRNLTLVSLVLRSILAVRGMLSSATFDEALDEFQQPLHFLPRADADANMAGGNVSAIAENDFFFGEGGDEIGTCVTEIDENKISSARVSLEAKLVQFFLKPWPRAQNVPHVALHRFGVANGGFSGDERGKVDGEGRRSAPKDGERVRMSEDGAKTKRGESGGL